MAFSHGYGCFKSHMKDEISALLFSCFSQISVIRETEKGKITLLRHAVSGRRYLLRVFSGDASVYRRLLSVKSPYLPEIFDVYEDGTEVAVLEEFVQGDSLAELLRGCLFNEKETRWTALDLLRGLCVLHSLGIVHRDIKPENVLLRPDGTAVLTDFDASRVSKAAQSRDTVAMGTVGFAAPEQFSITQTDARADIYSMGILINAMLTGEHPSSEIARGTLRKIVLKCTMIAPEKRFQSAKDLMEALE